MKVYGKAIYESVILQPAMFDHQSVNGLNGVLTQGFAGLLNGDLLPQFPN